MGLRAIADNGVELKSVTATPSGTGSTETNCNQHTLTLSLLNPNNLANPNESTSDHFRFSTHVIHTILCEVGGNYPLIEMLTQKIPTI